MNKNSQYWSSIPRPKAYLMALAITLGMFVIRFILHPYLQPYAPFQFFFFGCLMTEYFVGLGPALFSVTLSFLLGTYYFIMPYGVFDGMISRSDAIASFNFAFLTVFTIALVEYLQRTLYSRQLLLKVSQSHHKISLYRENDRLHLAKKAATTVRPFEKLFADFRRVLLLQPSDGRTYLQPLFYELSKDQYKEEWWNLFDANDQIRLKEELARFEDSATHQRTLTVTIRNGKPTELILECIEIGHEKVIVIRIAK